MKAKRRIGRRRVVPTPEVTKRICDVIAATGYDKDAYTLCGVTHELFYKWLRRGEEERKGPHRDFREAVEKARASRTISLVANIRKAGTDPKHWAANAWILERTDPRRFGQRIRIHVSEELDSALNRLREALTPEEYERALAALSAGDGDGEAEGYPLREGSSDFDGAEQLAGVDSEADASLQLPGAPWGAHGED